MGKEELLGLDPKPPPDRPLRLDAPSGLWIVRGSLQGVSWSPKTTRSSFRSDVIIDSARGGFMLARRTMGGYT